MATFAETMIVFSSEGLGGGEAELARKMMRGFIKMLTKQKIKPNSLFFLGDSVKLLVKDSPVLEFLRQLKAEGVEILACKAALEWYALEQALAVGQVSSTGSLMQKMSELEVITF